MGGILTQIIIQRPDRRVFGTHRDCSQRVGVCRPRPVWTNLPRSSSPPAFRRNA